jgi:hypothetical protein
MNSSSFPEGDIMNAIILLGVLQTVIEVFCVIKHQAR